MDRLVDAISWCILFAVCYVCWFCVVSNSEGAFVPDTPYKVNLLVDAIGVAENGVGWKSRDVSYPYGIKSVLCKEGQNGGCRAVTVRTVKNNVKRWKKAVEFHGFKGSYLEFLWYRFCPPTLHVLNENWLDNVKRGL